MALFTFVLLTHGLVGNVTSFDSHWVVPSSLSLLRDGDFNLNEYQPLLEASDYFAILCVARDGSFTYLPGTPREQQRACRGEYQYYYPLAVPALSAPLIWGIEKSLDAVRAVVVAVDESRSTPGPPRAEVAAMMMGRRFVVERLVASVFVALAAALVYLTCCEELSRGWASGLALVFAFATPAWSIGSRALWQHTLSMPLLAASLWILSAARRSPGLVPWAGLTLMTAFWVRPTNAVSLGAFSLYVLAFHRQRVLAYLAAMSPPILVFGGINYSIYHSLLTPYSSTNRASALLSAHQQFGEALTANLFSPGRGLFVFSPIFALAGFALRGPDTDRELRWLRYASIAVVFCHWILLSSFRHWWGGHCFGPRFFADMAPILTFLLIPAVQRIRAGSRTLAIVGAILVCWSAFVHSQGAMSTAALEWNNKPVDIDKSTERIWDWSHTSFLASFQTSEPRQPQ